MSYGLLGLKSQMEGEALQGLKELDQQQQQNKMFKDQADQAQKQQRQSSQIGMTTAGAMAGTYVMPGIGTAVGAAVGFIAGSFM